MIHGSRGKPNEKEVVFKLKSRVFIYFISIFFPSDQRKQLANTSWLGWRVLLLLFNLWLKGNKSWQIPSAQ